MTCDNGVGTYSSSTLPCSIARNSGLDITDLEGSASAAWWCPSFWFSKKTSWSIYRVYSTVIPSMVWSSTIHMDGLALHSIQEKLASYEWSLTFWYCMWSACYKVRAMGIDPVVHNQTDDRPLPSTLYSSNTPWIIFVQRALKKYITKRYCHQNLITGHLDLIRQIKNVAHTSWTDRYMLHHTTSVVQLSVSEFPRDWGSRSPGLHPWRTNRKKMGMLGRHGWERQVGQQGEGRGEDGGGRLGRNFLLQAWHEVIYEFPLFACIYQGEGQSEGVAAEGGYFGTIDLLGYIRVGRALLSRGCTNAFKRRERGRLIALGWLGV